MVKKASGLRDITVDGNLFRIPMKNMTQSIASSWAAEVGKIVDRAWETMETRLDKVDRTCPSALTAKAAHGMFCPRDTWRDTSTVVVLLGECVAVA